MFKPVSPKVDFGQLENKILNFWQKEKIFEKTLKNRKKKFVFYDGPPFATGLPHYGHILAMTIKDAICRYKTMQGFSVPRHLGWDCHGLPVEYEVEKELKISGKKQIEKMGIKKFCEECQKIVFRYTDEWEKTIDRLGRWADKENTYTTMELAYMESIWWIFKQIWKKGLIYQGFKSMPYCPRCGTPLSNFETNLGYRDDVPDVSIFIKFPLVDKKNTYLLGWTTTPWTLPGNTALAVNPEIEYAEVLVKGEHLILAKERLSVLGKEYKLVRTLSAKELMGKNYKPLYEFIPKQKNKKTWIVVEADFVNPQEGTGVVHIAPAFGEDDLELANKENLQIIQTVNEKGEFTNEVKPWVGVFVKEADKLIIEELEGRNLLFKSGTIYHTYPFCWRCESPLIYYAISTWFVKVSDIRQRLIKNNQKIHWVPAHIKNGRFGKWLEEARDWAVSRNRFWGTPLPIWQCEKCSKIKVIGGIDELRKEAVNFKTVYPDKVDLHRPKIDEIQLKCDCQSKMSRVEEVLDCWFESGSMPYAQSHYPFEDEDDFENNFPADFIAEGLDQTRGWFYTLHVVASILFDKPAFRNCIVNGIILDPQGRKLSKRLRNYPEPEEIFAKYGADSLRFFLLSSVATNAQDLLFSDKLVENVFRKLILMLINIYNFFATNALIDKWQPKDEAKNLSILDRWIISRTNGLINEITKGLESYNLNLATKPIQKFIEDLSTWYIRRSRDRLGPTAENQKDKEACYSTFYQVLVNLCKILAPFTPFLAEEIFKNLTGKESVHLEDWPKVNEKLINEKLEKEMVLVRKICELGHAARKEVKIRVRQPLNKFTIYNLQFTIKEDLARLIKDELNVKQIKVKTGKGELKVELETKITPELKAEGEARELVREIQELRKQVGCQLDQKIKVLGPNWPQDKKLQDYIKKETLTTELLPGEELKIK